MELFAFSTVSFGWLYVFAETDEDATAAVQGVAVELLGADIPLPVECSGGLSFNLTSDKMNGVRSYLLVDNKVVLL